MDPLDILILETSLPAFCLLLYAIILDVLDSLKEHGMLPVFWAKKVIKPAVNPVIAPRLSITAKRPCPKSA